MFLVAVTRVGEVVADALLEAPALCIDVVHPATIVAKQTSVQVGVRVLTVPIACILYEKAEVLVLVADVSGLEAEQSLMGEELVRQRLLLLLRQLKYSTGIVVGGQWQGQVG